MPPGCHMGHWPAGFAGRRPHCSTGGPPPGEGSGESSSLVEIDQVEGGERSDIGTLGQGGIIAPSVARSLLVGGSVLDCLPPCVFLLIGPGNGLFLNPGKNGQVVGKTEDGLFKRGRIESRKGKKTSVEGIEAGLGIDRPEEVLMVLLRKGSFGVSADLVDEPGKDHEPPQTLPRGSQ